MIVKKIRGQNKISKVVLSKSEVDLACSLGMTLEMYAKQALAVIAKKRKWKWYSTWAKGGA